MRRARELSAWLIAQGHTEATLAGLTTETKIELLRLETAGRIGWRAQALHTYLIYSALNSLQNSVRQLLSAQIGRRLQPIQPKSFEDLFDPEAAEAAKRAETDSRWDALFEGAGDDSGN